MLRPVGSDITVGIQNFSSQTIYDIKITISEYVFTKNLKKVDCEKVNFFCDKVNLRELPPNSRKFINIKLPDNFPSTDKGTSDDKGMLIVPLKFDIEFFPENLYSKCNFPELFLLRVVKKEFRIHQSSYRFRPIRSFHKEFLKLAELLENNRIAWIYGLTSIGKTEFAKKIIKNNGIPQILQGRWVYFDPNSLTNLNKDSLEKELDRESLQGVVFDDIHLIPKILDYSSQSSEAKKLLNLVEYLLKLWYAKKFYLILTSSQDPEEVASKLNAKLTPDINLVHESLILLTPVSESEFEEFIEEQGVYFDQSLLPQTPSRYLVEEIKKLKRPKKVFVTGRKRIFEDFLLSYYYSSNDNVYVVDEDEIKLLTSKYHLQRGTNEKKTGGKTLFINYNVYNKISRDKLRGYGKIIVFNNSEIPENSRRKWKKIEPYIQGELYKIIGGNPLIEDLFDKTIYITRRNAFISRYDMSDYLFELSQTFLNDITNFISKLPTMSLLILAILVRRFQDRLNINYPSDFIELIGGEIDYEMDRLDIKPMLDDIIIELENPPDFIKLLIAQKKLNDVKRLLDIIRSWLEKDAQLIMEHLKEVVNKLREILPDGFKERRILKLPWSKPDHTSELSRSQAIKSLTKFYSYQRDLEKNLHEITLSVEKLKNELKIGIGYEQIHRALKVLQDTGIIIRDKDTVFIFYVFYFIMLMLFKDRR